MTAASAAAALPSFAGLPLARWAFGLRVWAAMMLALCAAFWMELDGASSAGICVAILAQPTRGQVMEKALARFVATAIGVAASIAIAGLFGQERTLFIVAVSAWLGLCVFVCNMLDGNRAYAAVLSGYTVAIVAVMQIDKPQDVFTSGVNRGAAIAIGIAATALVNDLFASPALLPKVAGDLAALRRRSLDFVRAALRGGEAGPAAASDLFKAALALHPTLSSLEAESVMGANRAASARGALAAIVEEVMAARAVAGHGPAAVADPRIEELAGGLGDAGRARAARDRLDRAAAAVAAESPETLRLLQAAAVAERDRRAIEALADLAADRRPERATRALRLPLFRSRRVAARKGVRVGLAVALSAAFLVYSSWPQTSVAFALLAVVAGLAANAPSPTKFVVGALVALPAAAAVAGVLTFIVLDGADAFPLLCIAMAPAVVGACLILSSPNPKFGGIGFLLLVFTPVFMGLANPQSYDPLSYLFTVVLAMTAVLLLALWLIVLAPSTPEQRRRWFLDSAVSDLCTAVRGNPGWFGWPRRRDPAEAAHRAADRIAQLAALGPAGGPDHDAALADAFLLADLDGAVRRARHRLLALGRARGGAAAAAEGAAALRALDPAALRRAAARCRAAEAGMAEMAEMASGPPSGPDGPPRTGAALQLAADLAERHRGALQRLAPGLLPPGSAAPGLPA